ncbi:unnamed protein product [Trichogramma brassicae]|uniref:RNA-directed DNA polymerase n=1 Tax=Trichogramma brassicae TaxID=86971 RepID=A0A6H5INA0_9HYME|nr:unnamed protein product [Trichogramma brassicae]
MKLLYFTSLYSKNRKAISRADVSYGNVAGCFSDAFHVFNKHMKFTRALGGLTRGRCITESTVATWIGCSVVLLDMCNEMENFCSVTYDSSDQHVDSRVSRISRDTEDLKNGINDESVATFGRVVLRFFNRPCPLDIVRDNFPIEYDGILGMEFLTTQKAILSFADNRITIGGQSFRELPLVQHKTSEAAILLRRVFRRDAVHVGTCSLIGAVDGEAISTNNDIVRHRSIFLLGRFGASGRHSSHLRSLRAASLPLVSSLAPRFWRRVIRHCALARRLPPSSSSSSGDHSNSAATPLVADTATWQRRDNIVRGPVMESYMALFNAIRVQRESARDPAWASDLINTEICLTEFQPQVKEVIDARLRRINRKTMHEDICVAASSVDFRLPSLFFNGEPVKLLKLSNVQGYLRSEQILRMLRDAGIHTCVLTAVRSTAGSTTAKIACPTLALSCRLQLVAILKKVAWTRYSASLQQDEKFIAIHPILSPGLPSAVTPSVARATQVLDPDSLLVRLAEKYDIIEYITPHRVWPVGRKLRDYDYEIVHKPSRVNANADALSRNPVPISSPNPISPRNDDYEHEIERRIFSINCLPEVRERESHRGLARDGQKVDRQGELARAGGSPQGTAGVRDSLREELNPGDYHRVVSSYGQEFHLGDLASPNELRCHQVSSLHADGHESHLEEFLHLERRVSHPSTPPDEPSYRKRNADEMEVSSDDDEVEDELIEAKSYEHLDDMYWLPIETHLEELATSLHLNITICTGEVTTPNEEDRPNIIREAHDSAVAGHKRMIKTYHRVRARYHWPNMMEEIRRYVKTCHDCQIRKLTRVKTKFTMKITTTPTTAFEVVEMDVVGPLPITISGNKYLLTLRCNLTKYSEAIPLPDVKADMIASAFAKDFICRFGCPETLRTDMGQNLIGKVFSTPAKLFKIRQIHSTAYRPQNQGSLERSHHSLIEYLKMYINDRDWDTWIRYAIFSYNTSTHTAYGFTPHELVFARRARVPSEFANKTISKTYNDIIDDIARKLNITLKEAHAKIIEAKQKSKAYYDLKSNMRTFSPGDHVYLLKEHKTDKLDDHYTGPYLIKQLIGDRNVEIELGPSRSKMHVDKLKHAFLRL